MTRDTANAPDSPAELAGAGPPLPGVDVDLADVRKWHKAGTFVDRTTGEEQRLCRHDRDPWPCQFARLDAALDRLTAERRLILTELEEAAPGAQSTFEREGWEGAGARLREWILEDEYEELEQERDEARAEVERLKGGSGESHYCGCGLPMARNPHPNAGKLESLLEVGPVWVCVPCTVKSRHLWNRRAIDAEECVDALAAVASEWGEIISQYPANLEAAWDIITELAGQRFAATVERNKARAALAAERGRVETLREALKWATARMGILVARMRACHAETGKHELMEEAEMFLTEARAALAGEGGAK